jgi:prepilin-type processing-associated H-X9-DG protein
MQCTNNLKQWGIALHNYHDTNGAFPASQSAVTNQCNSGAETRDTFWSGTFKLFPYMEQGQRYSAITGYKIAEHPGVSIGGTPSSQYGLAPWQGNALPNEMQTPVPGLFCPSDGRNVTMLTAGLAITGDANWGGTTGCNIVMSCGDGAASCRHASEELSAATAAYNKVSRGLFMRWSFKTFGSMTDGSSNTIAASEAVSNPDAPYGNALKGSVYANTNFYLKSAGHCALEARAGASSGQINAPVAAVHRGQMFGDGRPLTSGFCTIIPPNGPSCAATNHDNEWGLPTASSNHSGGANGVYADGSVHFISETIQSNLDTTIRIVEQGGSGPSLYGIWGALGTPDGGESATP